MGKLLSRKSTRVVTSLVETMFQCDLCHFRNIQGRSPIGGDARDARAMVCIQRANLDALWSRETSTVKANLAVFKMICKNARDRLGYPTKKMLPNVGPFPVEDTVGMRMASLSVDRSVDPGINEDTIQHSTVRKFRSGFSNMWEASLEGAEDRLSTKGTVKMVQTTCPTNSPWYDRFSLGMHGRMGDCVKQDMALSVGVMGALMWTFELEWQELASTMAGPVAVGKVLFPALFSVIAYVVALRGEEVPLLDLAGTRNHFESAVNTPEDGGVCQRHAVIALLGRFKGETGEKYHNMVTVLETKSGLMPGIWIARALEWHRSQGNLNGPVFRGKKGQRVKSSTFQAPILRRLEQVQRKRPDLINAKVNLAEDFKVGRSFRRGSDSRALAEGLSQVSIDMNNRWRKFEAGRGKRPSLKMHEHYADVVLLLKILLSYSRAM
jgi:hypothetical protein